MSFSADIEHALVYCRVSSTKQAVQGHGLDSQEARCRDYAASKGYAVEAVFPDDASGGGDFMKRPGLVALLSYLDAQDGKPYAVIFDDLKRFARDTEFHIKLRREFKARNAHVECLNFKFEDTPEGRFIETIMAAQGELEREQNGRQVVQKMKARVDAGYYIFAPVVGYRFEKVAGHGKMLVPDEPNASIIREGLEGYASGRFQSQAEVKRFFEQYPSMPHDRHGEVRYTFVKETLERPLYAGLIDVEAWNIRHHPGKHEALISYETWLKVQERLNAKPVAPIRKDFSGDFPLRGFVRCSCCGNAMSACWSTSRTGKKHPYYLCVRKDCDQKRKSIRRADVERAFEEVLGSLTPTPGLFACVKEMFGVAWEMRTGQSKAFGKQLRDELARIDRSIEQLLDRIVETDSATVSQALERRVEKLEGEKRLMAEKIANMAKPKRTYGEMFELALGFLSNPLKLWETHQLPLQRTVLRLAFTEGLIYDRETGFRTPKLSLPFRLWGAI